MSKLYHSIIGPAASVLAAMRELVSQRGRAAILLDGDPGIGKTMALDLLASELADCPFGIERINGQSLTVDLVRQWRDRSAYGNLFSDWSIKRVDEIDAASSSAVAELLSFLDYLPTKVAILASTNEFAKLRAQTKGRLETRFHRFPVASPSFQTCSELLRKQYKLTTKVAEQISRGAVPDGCLISAGCNIRAAMKDAESYLAARASQQERRAA